MTSSPSDRSGFGGDVINVDEPGGVRLEGLRSGRKRKESCADEDLRLTFVRGHRLGVLERPAILQIGRDPDGAEGMAADRRLDAGRRGPLADHAAGLAPRLLGQQGSLPPFGGAGGSDISVQLFGQRMMAGNDVLLAAFIAQTQLPADAARAEVLNSHFQGSADAGEAACVGATTRKAPGPVALVIELLLFGRERADDELGLKKFCPCWTLPTP